MEVRGRKIPLVKQLGSVSIPGDKSSLGGRQWDGISASSIQDVRMLDVGAGYGWNLGRVWMQYDVVCRGQDGTKRFSAEVQIFSGLMAVGGARWLVLDAAAHQTGIQADVKQRTESRRRVSFHSCKVNGVGHNEQCNTLEFAGKGGG